MGVVVEKCVARGECVWGIVELVPGDTAKQNDVDHNWQLGKSIDLDFNILPVQSMPVLINDVCADSSLPHVLPPGLAGLIIDLKAWYFI